VRALAVGALLAFVVAAPAAAAPMPDVDSTYGSGDFGAWGVDGTGLPRYRYSIDEETAPQAAQPELNGSRDAFHQLGNDHIVADAFNHGYVQLWSQDRHYEWANHYEAPGNHFAGGYGYLSAGGKAYSTLYDDRPAGAATRRDFGVGYAERAVTAAGIAVVDDVYAPFGDDPVLLHDVTLRNTSSDTKKASWFEYWDVNPYSPGAHAHLGLQSPAYDAARKTLSVAQLPFLGDSAPLSIFAAALSGPVDGHETDGTAFFGAGGRKAPTEVAADRLSGTLAPPAPDASAGHTILAFRSPVTLKPGESVTLRYAYGMAHPAQIAPLVDRWRKADDPLAASRRAWADHVPKADLGPQYRWLARELEWDAYMVRSGSTYEECAGHHIISQGGYYQYDLGFQGAFRDPLQHALPMIYADPDLAREVLLYSARQQPQGGGQIPYAIIPMCNRLDLGTSDDLDLWLLLTSAEYGLASRDMRFFDQQVPWEQGGSATLWDHLKAAFRHQESQRGPHGVYLIGGTGDWSDFSTQFLQMTESTLVAAQTAYVYPRLAELADARGDKAFADELRGTAAGLRDVLRREWTGKGWYSRGYSGDRQIGSGVIFGEPQPWALLAGVPTDAQAATLIANIRKHLTGPSKIGSSQSPAANDPDMTETSLGGDNGVGDHHAVYVGGAWFAVNGWLAWALGDRDPAYAFDELQRNTLAAHATAYPGHWDGVLSVDDACRSWYSTDPANCGVGLSTAYNTQIMHQPAWSLFDAIKLAGIDPVADGYRIVPRLPLARFSLSLDRVSVQKAPGSLRGSITPEQGGSLRMRVAAPAGWVATADGRRVPASAGGGLLAFDLPTRGGQPATWSVSAPPATCASLRRFTIRTRLQDAHVTIAGRRVHVRRGRAVVDLRRRPHQTVTVRITGRTRAGKRALDVRRYRTCTKRR
jgi:glycosyl hydrolase family 36/glycosyl transferase family 36